MTISYQVSGVITNVGVTAAINAGITGPAIAIAGFRIGSLSAVDGSQALTTDTDVDGFVYQGSLAQMSYSVVDIDTVMWRIALDTTVGNFQVGNIGIVLAGNVLFAKAVLPSQSPKYMSNPPTTVGNVKFYNIIMRLANIANLLNLSIVESLTAALPEVATELVLPASLSSPFDCYMVDNQTHLGVPTTALRLNGNWYHAPHRLNPGQGQSTLACPTTLFDGSLPAICAVYMSTSNQFELADSLDPLKQVLGVRISSYEVMTEGQVPGTVIGVTGTLVPGTYYYVGSGGGAGVISTTVSGLPVGIAVSTTDIFFQPSAYNAPIATTTNYGLARQATQSEVTAGITTGPAPAFVTPEELQTKIIPSGSPVVATTTAYGIIREATLTEVRNGITTGLFPAAVIPEYLQQKIATNSLYGFGRIATAAEARAYTTSGTAPAFLTPEALAQLQYSNLRIYISAGTYSYFPTLPNIKVAYIEVIGGGGGGGGVNGVAAGTMMLASGGGAGGMAVSFVSGASIVGGVVVTVGAGGAGGSGTGFGVGGTGGTSSFGAFGTALGGSPGSADNIGFTGVIVTGSAAGGTASGGTWFNANGSPSTFGGGSFANAQAGNGGNGWRGVGGGLGHTSSIGPGGNATGIGAGGGGGLTENGGTGVIGGAGTNGAVLIWEYY